MTPSARLAAAATDAAQLHVRDSDDQRAQPFITKLAAGDVEDAERALLDSVRRIRPD